MLQILNEIWVNINKNVKEKPSAISINEKTNQQKFPTQFQLKVEDPKLNLHIINFPVDNPPTLEY